MSSQSRFSSPVVSWANDNMNLCTIHRTQLVWKVTKLFRNVLQIQSIPHDQEYLMNKNFWKSKYFIEPFFRISTIFILSNYCSKHTFNNPSVTFLWVKVSYFLYKIQGFSIETGHCTKVYNIHKRFWIFGNFLPIILNGDV